MALSLTAVAAASASALAAMAASASALSSAFIASAPLSSSPKRADAVLSPCADFLPHLSLEPSSSSTSASSLYSSYYYYRSYSSSSRRRTSMSSRFGSTSLAAVAAARAGDEEGGSSGGGGGRKKKSAKSKKSKKTKSKKSSKSATPVAAATPAMAKATAAVVGGSTAAVAVAPPPSKVTDEDGPTPPKPPFEPDVIDSEDLLSSASYDAAKHPIPYQPWRRGDTNGCEDPIDAQWRLEAEYLIEEAARSVGAAVEGVTWYLTFVVVTLGNDLSQVHVDALNRSGPKITVDTTRPTTNVWTDGPDDPNDPAGFPVGTFHGEEHARVGPEWADEDDEDDDVGGGGEPKYDEETGELLPKPPKDTRGEAVFAYQMERLAKLERRRERMKMLKLPGRLMPTNLNDAAKLEYDGFQKHVDDYATVLLEKYGDITNMTDAELDGALKVYNAYLWHMTPERLEEFKSYLLEKFHPLHSFEGVDRDIYDSDVRSDGITDDYADRLSKVGDAILSALSDPDVDSRLNILDRHEVVLTSTNFDPRRVETQREFDSVRNKDVYVQTRDPWNSNRVIKGKLADRNAMDVILNVGGRMVTIPNNMVGCVYLPETNKKARAQFEAIMAMEMEDDEEVEGYGQKGRGGDDEEYDDEDGEYDEDEEWEDDDDDDYEYVYEEEEEEDDDD